MRQPPGWETWCQTDKLCPRTPHPSQTCPRAQWDPLQRPRPRSPSVTQPTLPTPLQPGPRRVITLSRRRSGGRQRRRQRQTLFSLTFRRSLVESERRSRSSNLLFIDRASAPGAGNRRKRAGGAAAQGAGARAAAPEAPAPPRAPGPAALPASSPAACAWAEVVAGAAASPAAHTPLAQPLLLRPPPPAPSCTSSSSSALSQRSPPDVTGGHQERTATTAASGAARFPRPMEWSWWPGRPIHNDPDTRARGGLPAPRPSANFPAKWGWSRAAPLGRHAERFRSSATRGRHTARKHWNRRVFAAGEASWSWLRPRIGVGREWEEVSPCSPDFACHRPGTPVSRHSLRRGPGWSRGGDLSTGEASNSARSPATHQQPHVAARRTGAEPLPTSMWHALSSPGALGPDLHSALFGVSGKQVRNRAGCAEANLLHRLADKPAAKASSRAIPGCGVWGKQLSPSAPAAGATWRFPWEVSTQRLKGNEGVGKTRASPGTSSLPPNQHFKFTF